MEGGDKLLAGDPAPLVTFRVKLRTRGADGEQFC